MDTKFVAHKSLDDGVPVRWQSVKEHLVEVRNLAFEFGQDIGIPHVAGLAGWLHDAGKYSRQFQNYIVNGEGKRGSVNHAFAGALILNKMFSRDTPISEALFELVANSIMAHHNPKGPYDFCGPVGAGGTEFMKRVKCIDEVPEVRQRFFEEFDQLAFCDYCDKALEELERIGPSKLFAQQSFYQRFISSCLVDADHLKTADFMSGLDSDDLPDSISLDELFQRNEQAVTRQRQINASIEDDALSSLNRKRDEMSMASLVKADGLDSLLKLSVPTGGGKTLASLRFGLRRCVRQSLNRIIYIVPFTTVIEQNAASVRKRLALPADDYNNVLEYHSSVTVVAKKQSDEPIDARYYYARDTWDAPIIFTTQVAYLNALFGSGSKNLRHMHRLAKSVLIFDEIQSMPFKCIGMSNVAINWLTTSGHATGVLCTATQPALDVKTLTVPLNPSEEIVSNVRETERAFKRVCVENHLNETWSLTELTNRCKVSLQTVNSVLVVLNTKAAVKKAFLQFDQSGVRKFHLSTSMCAAHRQQKFTEISRAVTEARHGGPKVIVFSTKLIEAGVDLSFETVFRSAAGLDSIIQAAGRCNRNHELPMGIVYTFSLPGEIEKLKHLPDIKLGAYVTRQTVKLYPNDDVLSCTVICAYFKSLFTNLAQQLNYPVTKAVDKLGEAKSLLELIAATTNEGVPNRHGLDQYQSSGIMQVLTAAPQSVVSCFRPIDTDTIPVLVQWNGDAKCAQLITEIEENIGTFSDVSDLLKRAQAYTVQVYGDYATVKRNLGSAIVDCIDTMGLLIARETIYNDDFGLDLTGEYDSTMSDLII